MLIDASHPEETRVVIANGNRLEEFDVESESRKQLKGNIYLAKVTRVEPSLQACFVDYGGNRHGFLAFSEIHPDYYQIPIADREALVAEHQEQEAKAGEDGDDDGEGEGVEVLGGEDEEIPVRRPVNLRRQYKIQEVIKRRQILLVQVVKEERGNKGAALTTYLSLAGRYCVLMPNTARGGGISRKIAQSSDRKKLKQILTDLEIPQGMAVIVRTAGSKRTKAEIRRDYDYLLRLWGEVREKTLKSIAPSLVHEEGDIVKRAIRDLYTKDIDEIIVQGNEAYRAAKDFMKLLIPSHAKKVQPQEEGAVPVFQQFGVESQMHGMHEPEVQLRSGGYIVINPTEALVSIDVNSGRATKERNIEETALKTNMEAAEEIARQLRLRDLAGLIVIDFIDMEVNRNQTKVERSLKDAMRNDRARIQIGRISPFGLLELSRQRLRPSLHETSFEPCAHCGGSGVRRSTESTALQMLRVLGEEGQKGRSKALTLHTPTAVALYLFNNKRSAIADIEQRFDLTVRIEADDNLIPPDHRLDRIKADGGVETAVESVAESEDDKSEEEGGRRRRRRRRGRKRGDGEAQEAQDNRSEDKSDEQESAAEGEAETREGAGEQSDEEKPKRRRRGRRGGRRRRRSEEARNEENQEAQADGDSDGESDQTDAAGSTPEAASDGETDTPAEVASGDESGAAEVSADAGEAPAAESADGEAEAKPKPKRSRSRRSKKTADETADTETAEKAEGEDKPAKPRRRRAKKAEAEEQPAAEAAEQTAPEAASGGNGGAEPEPAPAPETAPESAAEPAPEPEAAAAASQDDDAEPAEDSAKTVVIEVGAGQESSGARRGWWNRLVE
jgi:ribonuclease E